MRNQAVTLLAPVVLASGMLALGVLAGCAETEPYERAGQWDPLGANAANLRAMVADPRDLEMGQAGGVSPGDIGAAAVARLRAGAVRPLPDSSISGVRTTDTGPAAAGGNEGPTAAAPVAAPPSGGSQ